jgi:DNA/RNA-binding domain of Phe-tRNA-synthetase-like protein
MFSLRIDPALVPVVSLGALALEAVEIVEREPRLDEPLREAEEAAREQPPETRAAVRAMYWKVGIDPTRRRPSSEALLRRVMRGDSLPRINSLVDVCNWCSLEMQLPYGLYDLDRVTGPVTLRLGTAGESYAGIGKGVVNVEGRLTLADASGPFGNPTSDSARTKVTAATSRALAVVFVPREVPARVVEAALRITLERASMFTGARQSARFVV